MPGLGTLPAAPNKYSYNGKEEQPMAGVYDYGARLYDGLTGRWGVVDPLAELSRRVSGYAMSYDNPLDATRWAYHNGTFEQYDANSLRTTRRIGPSSGSNEISSTSDSSEGSQGGPGPKKKEIQAGGSTATGKQAPAQQSSTGARAALVGGAVRVGTMVEGMSAATLEGIINLGRLAATGLTTGLAVLASGAILHGDQTATRESEKYIPLYRNVGENKLSSFIRKGYNFGTNGASLDVKEFWLTPQGLEFWKSTSFAKPYTIIINIPVSIIGPHRLVQIQELDSHPAAVVNPQNLTLFNRAKQTVMILKE